MFRRLCREQGAGLYVCEMITSRGLVEKDEATRRMLVFDPLEDVRSVQLYGTDPRYVGEATRIHADGEDRMLGRPSRFGLGFQLPMPERKLGPSEAAFGHFGAGGSGAWADPERELGVAIVTNCIGGVIPGDLRPVAVATVSSRCADRRRA